MTIPAGTRIRLNDRTPWPIRRGCEGVVVEAPNGSGIYPDDRRGRTSVIVLLDDDPLAPPTHEGWTCVVAPSYVEVVA